MSVSDRMELRPPLYDERFPSARTPECPFCGAFMQLVLMDRIEFWRCPWAIARTWTIRLVDTPHHGRILCNWPRGMNRRPG